jgi:hypothetical protein
MGAFAEPGTRGVRLTSVWRRRGTFSGATMKQLLIGFALGIICIAAFLSYSAGNL